jgi:hypothetical protein
MRIQALIGSALFVLGIVAAWGVGVRVADGDMHALAYVALGFAACGAIVATLRNWRTGFFLFFVWMMFEDLPRKYLGNQPVLFFGKDLLLFFVYLSFYVAVRRKREKTFRPPFLLFFSFFLLLGTLQIFNPNAPHMFYGLLGFKVYFYYVPLLFVGYALVRSDEDLRKFLVLNAGLAAVIGGLGIAQAILGQQFLNPQNLAPDLESLGNLTKTTPLSHQGLYLPDSIFVSSGRFALFSVVAVILALATAAYLLLSAQRGRKVVFISLGVSVIAVILCGGRGAFVSTAIGVVVLGAAFLWGAPWRWRQAHRLVRAMRRSVMVVALGLTALIVLFPEEAGSRLAYYTETLNPDSSAYELSNRTWDYPVQELLKAFDDPHWVVGNGIGTASLSSSYVARVLGERPPGLGVEEGYGTLMVEMGVLAPLLWIMWTAALLYYAWKVTVRLRQTRLFPVGCAIVWYAFYLLYMMTFASLVSYQNYTTNIYLWLLVGMLFRLPDLLANPAAPVVVSPQRISARSGFQF